MDAERLGCETNPLRAEFQLTVEDVPRLSTEA